MFLPTSEIEKVATEFLTLEIAPKLPIGPKYMLLVGIGMMSGKLINDQTLSTLKLIGVIDEHNRVDLDKAKIAATNAMTQVGGKLPMANYVADQADIEAIYRIASKYATPS